MKKLRFLSLIIILTLFVNTVALASNEENTDNNLEYMSEVKRSDIVYDIIDSILKHDMVKLNNNKKYITEETYKIISSYVIGNIIGDGTVSDYIIDIAEVNESSTVDYVILANLKINYTNCNMMYLFEFHVNADGLIYGYNIWVY